MTEDAQQGSGRPGIARSGARRLRRTSSADQAAASIRRAIIAGVFVKGEHLSQSTIAADLGLSRIPVREAFITLDREGWVRFEAHRGATVASFGADEIRDHYELRGLVLGLVTRRVATSATDDDRAELTRRHEALRDAPDDASFSDRNDRFLGKLLRIADSPRLTAALLVTPSIIPEGFFDVVPDARHIQATGTAAVVHAVRRGDADAADQAMRALLARQGEAVVAAFTASGLVERPAPAPAAPLPVVGTNRRRPRRSTAPPDEPTAEAVARHVRALIFDGELEPGRRLPQDDIADDLGTSRIPVREAIIALEREGWLRVEPHRGAFVLPLDETATIDRFALAARLHGFAARRAIEHLGPDDLDALARSAAQVAAARTADAMDAAHARYLATLVAIAASSRLGSVLRSIGQVVPGNLFASVPDALAIQQHGVARLQAAVEARDPVAAEQAADEVGHALAVAVIAVIDDRRADPARP